VVPLKISKKKWGHFLKMDILKISNFQKAIIKFSEKSEKFSFTHIRFKYQKNTSNFVSIIFLQKKWGFFVFPIIYDFRKQKNPKKPQIILRELLL
jgi:hypothetical protein